MYLIIHRMNKKHIQVFIYSTINCTSPSYDNGLNNEVSMIQLIDAVLLSFLFA